MRGHLGAVVGGAVAIALLVTGLSGTPTAAVAATTKPTPTSDPGNFPGYTTTLAKYAAQPVDWAPCYDDGSFPNFECAFINLPRDWHRPNAGDIQTDITRVKATGPHRRGILLTNPGGPGEFGYWMPLYFNQAEPDLNAAYDIIGMDPRGTWVSTLDCVNPKIFDPVSGVDLRDTSPQAIALQTATWKKYAQKCSNDDLTKTINTDQTARDFDLVRAMLGENKASYIGYSAGTWLGTWWATLFPSHVDRILLDGNADTVQPWVAGFDRQPPAFQNSFESYLLPWLAQHDSTYHLGKTARAVENRYEARRAALQAHPLTLPDGDKVAANEYDDGIVNALYDTADYPDIGDALAAIEHPATATPDELDLITTWFGPVPWAANDNVFYSIICNDTAPLSISQTFTLGMTLARKYPLTGAGYWFDACDYWKLDPTGSPVTGKGIPPLLMLQNDDDPATPYGNAVSAHNANPNSVLVTVQQQSDHTIYGEGDPCVENAANAWLIDGMLPKHDKTCAGIPLPEVDSGAVNAAVAGLAGVAGGSARPAGWSPLTWYRDAHLAHPAP